MYRAGFNAIQFIFAFRFVRKFSPNTFQFDKVFSIMPSWLMLFLIAISSILLTITFSPTYGDSSFPPNSKLSISADWKDGIYPGEIQAITIFVTDGYNPVNEAIVSIHGISNSGNSFSNTAITNSSGKHTFLVLVGADTNDTKYIVSVNATSYGKITDSISFSFPIFQNNTKLSRDYSKVNESQWQIYYLDGSLLYQNHPWQNKTFMIPYRTDNAEVETIEYESDSRNRVLFMKIHSENSSLIEIVMTRGMLGQKNSTNENEFYVLTNNNGANYNEKTTHCFQTYRIKVPAGDNGVQIVHSLSNGSLSHTLSGEIPIECFPLSPKQQITFGIAPDDVQCSDNYLLVKKRFSSTTVCMTQPSAAKLVLRGIGIIDTA